MNTTNRSSPNRHFFFLPVVLLVTLLALPLTICGASKTVSFPILLYHNISTTGEGESTIAHDVFLSHLDALQNAGYQTITLSQMIAYVTDGEPLPQRPVLITFDDGYRSNYDFAWPALKERGMVGTIFLIGSSVGKDVYKDTGVPIIPHFSFEQAREMVDSGVISIQSHTYDLHQYRPLEPDGGREGVLPKEGESDSCYRQTLERDFQLALDTIRQNTGEHPQALAYPYGLYTQTSEAVSRDLGIPITLTTQAQKAQLRQHDPNSLRLLGRYTIDDCTPQELLALIQT